MIRSMTAYIDFCYLVRRPKFNPADLDDIDRTVKQFHKHREVFRAAGVRPAGFSTPRLHATVHYRHLIEQFGAPGGLCTSITESKHIKAVKEPYRRSNRYEALGQMLTTNQRLDKLAASRVDFVRRGMLAPKPKPGAVISSDVLPGAVNTANTTVLMEDHFDDTNVDDTDELVLGPISNDPVDDVARPNSDICLAKTPGLFPSCPIGYIAFTNLYSLTVTKYPRQIDALSKYIGVPTFPALIYRFLLKSRHPNHTNFGESVWQQQVNSGEIDVGPIKVFNTATAQYVYLSDRSGKSGFQKEIIYANPSWRGHRRFDCVFINTDPTQHGFRGMHVARVYLFFSFICFGEVYPCALVRWFQLSFDDPCSLTGMWIVEPEFNLDNTPSLSVIHANSIHRAAHLMPVFGQTPVPDGIDYTQSLDSFNAFYVSKYADHHSHEVLYEAGSEQGELNESGSDGSE